MKVVRRAILVVVVLTVVALVFQFVSGYRLTPRDALRTMPIHITKDTIVFDDLNFGWAHVYLTKTNSAYKTAIVERRGVFWRLIATTVIQKSSDPVKTIGWASVSADSHQLTVLAVETTDPQVRSIEAGPLESGLTAQILRKHFSPGHPVVISWDNTSFVSEGYKAIALSVTGKELYYYGYPKNTKTVNFSEPRWYPASSKG